MNLPLAQSSPAPPEVLARAVRSAGKALGLTQAETGAVIGRDRTSLRRPLDPSTKPGELGLLLVRCHRSLFVLTGGEEADMVHWMRTPNRHTGGVPREQLRTAEGLVRVVAYLDAMRAKV